VVCLTRPTLGAQKRRKPTALNAQHQTKQGNGENPFSSHNKKAEFTLKTCETFFYAKSMKQKHPKNRIMPSTANSSPGTPPRLFNAT
jgi:hypothetical protein